MLHHRFHDPLPKRQQPAIDPRNFLVCPLVLVQGLSQSQQLWQSALYRLAFEQALAMTRPSILDRDLLAAWN
jgi:hypothetical protein